MFSTDLKQEMVTIANGASLSDAAHLNEYSILAIVMPSAWTAAAITFETSMDGTTFQDAFDDGGTEISLTVAASRNIELTSSKLRHAKYIKLRSGTTSTPVNQGAASEIFLICKRVTA